MVYPGQHIGHHILLESVVKQHVYYFLVQKVDFCESIDSDGRFDVIPLLELRLVDHDMAPHLEFLQNIRLL